VVSFDGSQSTPLTDEDTKTLSFPSWEMNATNSRLLNTASDGENLLVSWLISLAGGKLLPTNDEVTRMLSSPSPWEMKATNS